MKHLFLVLCFAIAHLVPLVAVDTQNVNAPVPCELGPGVERRVVSVDDTTYAVLGTGGRFALVDRKNRRVKLTRCVPDVTAELQCIVADNDGYLVGTINGAVWRSVGNEWVEHKLPVEDVCNAIAVWRNTIFAATMDGTVWRLSESNIWQEEYKASHPLFDFVVHPQHLVVIGDSSTIAMMQNVDLGFETVSRPDSIARFMCGVALGNEILLGADKGMVYRYNVASNEWNSVKVFTRFYDRQVRSNAPRDLPGHVRALALMPSGEILASGSWVVDLAHLSPLSVVATSLDSGRSWTGFKLGGFVRLEQQQLPFFPDAPYRNAQGIHVVHESDGVCTNIILDSAEKRQPPEMWFTPLRYHFDSVDGLAVARTRNNVLAVRAEGSTALHVFQRLTPLKRVESKHPTIMLKTIIELRDGVFRELRRDTLPWVTYTALVSAGTVYVWTDNSTVVAAEHPFETWDTIVPRTEPGFMVFPHPRGMVYTTFRMHEDVNSQRHPIGRIIVVDRQGNTEIALDEDTLDPALVMHVQADPSGAMLACSKSGPVSQQRFVLMRKDPGSNWTTLPDLPESMTYASGPVMYQGVPTVYAWSQTGTGSARRFLLHSLQLINGTDWKATPVMGRQSLQVSQQLQSSELYQFVTSAVDSLHVLQLGYDTYLVTPAHAHAVHMTTVPGYGSYTRSVTFYDDQVILCGDDELLGLYSIDKQTSVIGQGERIPDGTEPLNKLQYPITIRGYDVLGRPVRDHVAHSSLEAQQLLQGAPATIVPNGGREVRYLVVGR
jgi:hypothetical protein